MTTLAAPSLSEEIDVASLAGLDSTPMCEVRAARPVHGDGEVAFAWMRIQCPKCQQVDGCFIGRLCAEGITHAQRLDSTYRCSACETPYPISLAELIVL